MSIQNQATSTTFSTLDKAWGSVLSESQNGDGYYSVRVFGSSDYSVFVGQHQPSGLIDVAFEVSPKSIKKIHLAQEAKGFEVKVQKTEGSANIKIRRVCVTLNRHSFSDLFKVLAVDIVEHCLKASSEVEAMMLLHSRLEHWRRFSEKAGEGGLTVQEQTGLFGELLFLQTLLEKGVDSTDSLKAWHGPLRENQDFCFGTLAVEVKASVSNTPNLVTISNIRQLDSTGLDKLYLYHVSLDRREGSGKTLPSVIDELLDSFKSKSESEVLFQELLMLQGYHHSQSNLYQGAGYTEREHNFYVVLQGFPRILERDLVDGVSGVRYKIDLSCASPFKKELKQTILAIKQNMS